MKIACKCGEFLNTDIDFFRITKYENRPILKRKSFNNKKITREIIFSFICPKCEKQIVDIHRYSTNALGNQIKIEYEQLRGIEAEKYLEFSKNNRKEKDIILKIPKYTKGVPLSYFKSINEKTQRPRFLNEVCYSGNKVVNEIKVYNNGINP